MEESDRDAAADFASRDDTQPHSDEQYATACDNIAEEMQNAAAAQAPKLLVPTQYSFYVKRLVRKKSSLDSFAFVPTRFSIQIHHSSYLPAWHFKKWNRLLFRLESFAFAPCKKNWIGLLDRIIWPPCYLFILY